MGIDADLFIHSTAVVDQPCEIGKGSKIWHFSHLMKDCIIGEKCSIGQNVFIGSKVILGKNVKIQNNVSVFSGVVCEDDVFLGPSVVFTNIRNPRSTINRRDKYLRTIIRKGVSVGANSTILCGIMIGEYAFIGAGSVVTKSVAPYSLVMGNPARHHGWISEYGHQLEFDCNGIAYCRESKDSYQLKNDKVFKIQP